jgi:carbon-monoxide dehydrogenase medium subunit
VDLQAAIAALRAAGGSAHIVAGGQSLLPALRSGMLQATRLVSLRKITLLKAITTADGVVSIGAEVTFSDFLASPQAAALPFLAHAVNAVGNHTIRNRTTFAGSVAWADPMGALLLALTMLDAVVVTTHRRLAAADCVAGVYRNSLASDEIIVAIEIALPPAPRRFGFHKTTARRSGGKALASVAAALDVHGEGQRSLRLGVLGLQDRAWVSAWWPCTAVPDGGDLGKDVDAVLATAPAGERFSPLLPSLAYLRASAALVCQNLIREIGHV